MPSETHAFNADISQLMNLIINTFYSTKEVFLRELISNASDACDKIQFLSLQDPEILGDMKDLRIDIIPDKVAKTLTIRDTGIGMTKADLISCIGTIANSGAKQFMEMVQEGADVSLIGQFGVGFYSAYLVANRVTVVSKHNDDTCHSWTSTAGGSFTIDEVERPDMIRGTEITLLLKDDQLEYLEKDRLESLIKHHSMFISHPIYLHYTKEVEKEVEVEEAKEADAENKDEEKKTEEDAENKDENKVEEASQSDDEEDKEKEKEKDESKTTKTIKVEEQETEHVNKQPALWTRDPQDVTEEQYADFYKHINPTDWEGHLAVSHFRIDGAAQFRGILYIPRRAPFDLWETQKKKTGIQLMVKRVFITDECAELVPEWLTFLRGVIDCDDLPLNISREMLQKNRIVNTIRKNIVKKALKLIGDLEENKEKWDVFLTNFGKNIKLGIHEDADNREKLAKFLRYYSNKSSDKRTSLDDYITRMAPGQKSIYYITGDNRKSINDSPFLERFTKKNIEVLFMDEAIDEYMVSSLREYEGKQLKCITKDGLDVEATEDEKKKIEEDKQKFAPLCSFMASVLGDRVEGVRVSSDRLVSSPCVLVTSEWGWSANMSRIMKHQALRDDTLSSVMSSKKTMEINADSAVIKSLASRLSENPEDESVRNTTTLLYETSLIASGFDIEDPAQFSKRIYAMVKVGLNAEDDEEETPAAAEDVPALEEAADVDELDPDNVD